MGGLPLQNDSTYPVYFGVIALYNNNTRGAFTRRRRVKRLRRYEAPYRTKILGTSILNLFPSHCT